MRLGLLQQLLGIRKRKRDLGRFLFGRRTRCGFRRRHDKPASDGIVLLFRQGLAISIQSGQTQAVRVQRQRLAAVKQKILGFVEGDLAPTREWQTPRRANLLDLLIRAVWINSLGLLTAETQDQSFIRRVPFAGQRQRAKQVDLNSRDAGASARLR